MQHPHHHPLPLLLWRAWIWLRSLPPAFRPVQPWVGHPDITLASLGAAFGLFGAAFLSRAVLGEFNPWFIAPMGASSVLLFAAPASPLAQPWSMLGGNVVSALVGVACVQVVHALWPDAPLALTVCLAGGTAIAAMFALRCLHPPGGAVALTAVLGGPAVTALGWRFTLWPVALNSALLLAMALLYSALLRRPYPHQAQPNKQHATRDPLPSARLGFSKADLDAALASQGTLLDISPEDLEQMLIRVELQASRRKFGDLLCRDIMARDVVSVAPNDSVDEAWTRLARHQVKALPVVRDDATLAGIVSLQDFFIAHGEQGLHQRPVLDTARQAQDIMTREVRTARPEQPLVELVELFSDGGLHHMPVVDEGQRVVGMITQSDVVAALFRAGKP